MDESMDGMEKQAAEREVQRLFEQIVPRVAASITLPPPSPESLNDPKLAMSVVVFAYKVALASVAIRPQMMSMLPDFVEIARKSRETTS